MNREEVTIFGEAGTIRDYIHVSDIAEAIARVLERGGHNSCYNVGSDIGILSCYQARTGEKVYRTRLARSRAAYSASPVACDGRIYFTSEEGDVHVVKAGPEYELLSTNPMGEVCLATPAISDRMIFVRTSKHLFGIGEY